MIKRAIAHIWGLVAVCLIVVAAIPAPAESARRLALVIGNNQYDSLAPLQKAVNDANAMTKVLQGIGFKVTPGFNLGRRAMLRTISKFAASIKRGDEVFVFYAGHGVALDGANYLIPSDMEKPEPGDNDLVKFDAIPVNRLVDRIRNRGAKAAMFVFDACRDNPFPQSPTRSTGQKRGFTRIEAPSGVFVLFSAGIGQAALDGLSDSDNNPNSVFTRHLVPLLKTPGMTHVALAKRVQRQVYEMASSINHSQQPAYYDQVLGEILLNPAKPEPPKPVGPAPTTVDIKKDFELARQVGSAEAWEAFLARHGRKADSFYVQLAKAALKKVAVGIFPNEPGRNEQLAGPCAHKDAILGLARLVMRRRLEESKKRFGGPKRVGTRALYLLMQYDGLTPADRREILNDFRALSVRDKPRGFDHLIFAYLAHKKGLDAAFDNYANDDPKTRSPTGWMWGGLRAMLLAGPPDNLFNRFKDNRRAWDNFYQIGAVAIVDQPDNVKLRVARQLEKHDVKSGAFFVLFSMKDRSEMHAFLKRNSADRLATSWWNLGAANGHMVDMYHGHGPILVNGWTEDRIRRQKLIHKVLRASFVEEGAALLGIVLNQTGETLKVSEASDAFAASVENGAVNPRRDPAEGVIAVYRELVRALGRRQVDKTLGTFSIVSGSFRFEKGKFAIDIIRSLIAGKALRGFVQRLQGSPGGRPDDLGQSFDWANWVRVAKHINEREFTRLPKSKDFAPIVAELLYQSGRFDKLIEYLEKVPALQAVNAATGLAERLDRRCSAFLSYPGNAIMLGGDPVYRFDN